MGFAESISRRTLVRRAMLLEATIITYNVAEGVISIVAGLMAGSVVLVAFGLDSAIEVSAAVVVLYHLARSQEEAQPAWERSVAKFVGLTLLLVAAYVLVRSTYVLATGTEPEESYLGIAITGLSVIVMPTVSRLQRMLADRIRSEALAADAKETLVCTYLSVAALIGLAANAAFGWWWADPVSGLALVFLIAREGWEIFRNRELLCVD